jgi:hypothetical protein
MTRGISTENSVFYLAISVLTVPTWQVFLPVTLVAPSVVVLKALPVPLLFCLQSLLRQRRLCCGIEWRLIEQNRLCHDLILRQQLICVTSKYLVLSSLLHETTCSTYWKFALFVQQKVNTLNCPECRGSVFISRYFEDILMRLPFQKPPISLFSEHGNFFFCSLCLAVNAQEMYYFFQSRNAFTTNQT